MIVPASKRKEAEMIFEGCETLVGVHFVTVYSTIIGILTANPSRNWTNVTFLSTNELMRLVKGI